MQFNSQFYLGAIEGYEKELERAKSAGITIEFNRLEQFKSMWKDFKEMEDKLADAEDRIEDLRNELCDMQDR
mgnify:CR=1 FL=1